MGPAITWVASSTFKPVSGYARKAEYDQVNTISGRLVDSKHSVRSLTLPSQYRKIFKSHWGNNGILYQIDFNNLEPRLIRKLNNQECGVDISSIGIPFLPELKSTSYLNAMDDEINFYLNAYL